MANGHAEFLGERPVRVAFMVKLGTEERPLGGLCEEALAAWIQDAIRAQISEGAG